MSSNGRFLSTVIIRFGSIMPSIEEALFQRDFINLEVDTKFFLLFEFYNSMTEV